MSKCGGQPSHDFKSKTLPQSNCTLIRTNHEIELHGAESAGSGVVERMRAHRACYAASGSPRRGDVAAIGDVGPAAELVRSEEVSAYRRRVLFRQEDFMGRREPIFESGIARNVSRQRVGLASANNRLEYRPNGVCVAIRMRWPDKHAQLSQRLHAEVKLSRLAGW